MRHLFTYILASKKELATYGLVGGSGVLLDLGLLIFLKEWGGFSAIRAVIFSQILVVFYSFFLQKYWTFGNTAIPHRQFVRFVIMYGANYLIAIATMAIFHDYVGFDYKLVRIGTIALSVSWNFLLYKYWVFRR